MPYIGLQCRSKTTTKEKVKKEREREEKERKKRKTKTMSLFFESLKSSAEHSWAKRQFVCSAGSALAWR